MKPSIRTAVLALTMLGALAPGLARSSPPVSNNPLYTHARQVQEEQRAPQFSIGDTVYQLVPEAMLVPGEQAQDASAPDARVARGASSAPTAASRIGPYAIVLAGNNGALRARSAAASTGGYEVAVNMKTGQPVLMLPQLQLQVRESGHGEELARALGGTLLFDGPASLMVVVGFDNVAAALRALPQARAMDEVTQAQPALQRRFRRLR